MTELVEDGTEAEVAVDLDDLRKRHGKRKLVVFPFRLLFLVFPNTYTVNLCVFYFSRLIGKLTAFLEVEEFNLCDLMIKSVYYNANLWSILGNK